MGVGATFAEAFVKSQLASGEALPDAGKVFISVRDEDKPKIIEIARKLAAAGYALVATRGTAAAISATGLAVTPVNKVQEGRPHIVDMVKNGEIALIVNTVEEKRTAVRDSYAIRRAALQERVALYTTLAGARAACTGMEHVRELHPYAMQTLHKTLTVAAEPREAVEESREGVKA
jgi:carbamoyl-phosphate synthase large subunit